MSRSQQLRVGSLFSGIGGFDLGFERAGMRTEWFVECDPYCQAVLKKHWPEVPCYEDVRSVTASAVHPIDLLCGGFPCQDLSVAGRGAGLDGARSGLWSEFARLIGELRPQYVVVENVPMLRSRGLGRVLGEMAAFGYDAEWDCLPASAFGAPHRRDRIWIVAYPSRDAAPRVQAPARTERERTRASGSPCGTGEAVADANGPTRNDPWTTSEALSRSKAIKRLGRCGGSEGHPWTTEPDVGRVAHGVPARMDRLRALGNALVPQIAEWIGQKIVAYEAERVNA